jgi:conjugal transfer mating pair stabilization protein TraN
VKPYPISGLALALALTLTHCPAVGQTTRAEAFNQGKSYKPATAAIKEGIEPKAIEQVPGQDAATTGELGRLYGTSLNGPGNDKLRACAAFLPGSDQYKNQECETVNYVARNGSERRQYSIDKSSDPTIIRSRAVRSAPRIQTSGTSGLSGTYSACTEKSTGRPERFDTERCQVGRSLIPGQCITKLTVAYNWQRYAAQVGADLRYGRCVPGQIRGDELKILVSNSDTTQPRTNENCFSADGVFTEKVMVPVFRDQWDQGTCAGIDASAVGTHCGVVSAACPSGPATSMIDGMAVSRPCWEKSTQFSCIGSEVTDTCGPAVSKGCTQASSVCQQSITVGGDDQCITEQREYTCKVADGASSTTVDCSDQTFCVAGNCFDTGSPPDPDFAKAVTAMEVAREAGVYIDQGTFQVFKGQDNRCSKTVASNCCKGASKPTDGLSNLAIAGGSAYAFDVLGGSSMTSSFAFGFDPTTFALAMSVMVVQEMLACESEEVLVAVRRDHGLCHYVGDYCSKHVNLLFAKVCIKHKETHCCFNSKIAKIINEAARVQTTGLAWGTPEAPSCGGLTLAQFQSIDLSTVDFSEFYADIKPKGPDQGAIRDNAAAKVQSYFGR